MTRQDPSMVKQKSVFACPNRLGLAICAGLCVDEIVQGLKESTEGQAVMRNLLETPCWLCKSVSEFVVAACRNCKPSFRRNDGDTCPWASSLVLMAREGCLFGLLPQLGVLGNFSCCVHCAEAYANGLRERRRDLKQLALKVLPSTISERLGLLQPKLLGRHAAAVIQTLQGFGVKVPARLSIANAEDNHVPLYHSPWAREEMLNALHAAGFQDTDAPDQDGLTPLQRSVCKAGPLFPLTSQWLLDHGADMARPYVPYSEPRKGSKRRKRPGKPRLYPHVVGQLQAQHAVLDVKLVHVLAFFTHKLPLRKGGANACTIKRILTCTYLKD